MAIYAVGDIQGCHRTFLRLLDKLKFDPGTDHLYCVGDLVNRGPDSLGVLRTVRELGDAVTCVLGNHDLHLIGLAAGVRRHRSNDSLKAVLRADDRDDLLAWLRHRPLMVIDRRANAAICHAGIYPGWSIDDAHYYAAEVEARLRGPDYLELLKRMWGNKPEAWNGAHSGYRRMRFIINAFTRMRYLRETRLLDMSYSGPPGTQPDRLSPWYKLRKKDPKKRIIVFGHWSALGAKKTKQVVGLDSGCVWGGRLTAVRLDKKRLPFISVKAKRSL